jgi:hypothetical protein
MPASLEEISPVSSGWKDEDVELIEEERAVAVGSASASSD